jgi:hypothetical protein
MQLKMQPIKIRQLDGSERNCMKLQLHDIIMHDVIQQNVGFHCHKKYGSKHNVRSNIKRDRINSII